MKNQFGENTNENISKISALEVSYFKVTTKYKGCLGNRLEITMTTKQMCL